MALWGKKTPQSTRGIEIPTVEAAKPDPSPKAVEKPAAPEAPTNALTPTAANAPMAAAPSPGKPAIPPLEKSGANPTGSAAAAEKTAGESKRLLMTFGGIVSVLMKTPQFKGLTIGQLETLVVPAILSGQFVLAEAQAQDTGMISPVGTALWALVSADVDKRLSEDLDKPMQLAANEWRSGSIPWLVLTAGDARVINPMLRNVQQGLLKGTPLKVRTRGPSGKMEVGVFKSA